jgi:O-acetyl-ADP-ribose deacetylase (regulator of RNase III)
MGDITDQDVDAIVNAANSSLMGGGGVDGAIHSKGGPSILEECKRIRRSAWPDGLPTGEAVISGGGRLKAKHVIHTVGPRWREGDGSQANLLASCYRNSLKLAKKNGLKSVAFPSISTGAYGYPMAEASRIALNAVKGFLEREGGLAEVRFVLFTDYDLDVYLRALEGLG